MSGCFPPVTRPDPSFLQSSTLQITLTPGAKLGDYEVRGLLGSGGMGEVYRARDTRLGREVAIKVYPRFCRTIADRLRRFEQEARAVAALNHPNILAVFQMGTYEGAPYLVSELLEGETLRESLRSGALPVRKAVEYAAQVSRGLVAAHQKGIVHRDLKPENIFVTRDGRVKILDFGLAKLTHPGEAVLPADATLTAQTEPGVVMGTMGYMSPEQVKGLAVDHRTDLFSLGAILCEMLTGKQAFQKPTSAEVMAAILHEDPPDLSQMNPKVPPALQRLVHRCLEKDSQQRFQSASDLAFALEELLGSGSHTAVPIEAAQSRVGRRWLLLGAAAALLAVAITILFAGTLLKIQHPRWRLRFCRRPAKDSGQMLRNQPPSLRTEHS